MKIDLNLLDARDLLAKKEISSHELTKTYLDNIKKGEELNCYNTCLLYTSDAADDC